MANYTFSGPCRWAKVYTPDEKFGPKYSIEIQLSPDELKKYKEAGCMGNASKDGEGYYTFRRTKTILTRKGKVMENGAPQVLDAEGNPTTVTIGNGSEVTVKVETYPTDKGVGTKLVAVRIDKLVEYKPNVGDENASIGSTDVGSDTDLGERKASRGNIKNPF